MDLSELSGAVIGAAIEVHRELGPGLLESASRTGARQELGLRKVSVQRQVAVPLEYKGLELGDGFRLDLLVDDALVVEVKAVDRLQPIHDTQLFTHLKLANKRLVC